MGTELDIWRAPQDWSRDSSQEHDHGTGTGGDAGIEPDYSAQVRTWSTERLRILIKNLQPYIDGTFGTVSTKHAQQYMSAVRELNKLWRAYWVPPPEPEPEPDLEAEEVARTEAAQVTRKRVLTQLDELRSRSRQGS